MKPIKITKVYNNLDDTSACWITFLMNNGSTTDIIIDTPNYRKLASIAMENGYVLQYETTASDNYVRKEFIKL